MSKRALCTVERGYLPIPQTELDNGWNKAVHVENWPASYRFHYADTTNGIHTITSSRGRYTTPNRLMYTKRYQPQR